MRGKSPPSLCKRGYCTAKALYKVYPSARANQYASSVCKGSRPDYEGMRIEEKRSIGTGLRRWEREKWVDTCSDPRVPCGESEADFEYCRPTVVVNENTPVTADELGIKMIERMCAKKRKDPSKRVTVHTRA